MHGRRACYPIYLNNNIIILYYTGLAFNDHQLAWAYLPFSRTNHRRQGDITIVVISVSRDRPHRTRTTCSPSSRPQTSVEIHSTETIEGFGQKTRYNNYYALTSRGRLIGSRILYETICRTILCGVQYEFVTSNLHIVKSRAIHGRQ